MSSEKQIELELKVEKEEIEKTTPFSFVSWDSLPKRPSLENFKSLNAKELAKRLAKSIIEFDEDNSSLEELELSIFNEIDYFSYNNLDEYNVFKFLSYRLGYDESFVYGHDMIHSFLKEFKRFIEISVNDWCFAYKTEFDYKVGDFGICRLGSDKKEGWITDIINQKKQILFTTKEKYKTFEEALNSKSGYIINQEDWVRENKTQ